MVFEAIFATVAAFSERGTVDLTIELQTKFVKADLTEKVGLVLDFR